MSGNTKDRGEQDRARVAGGEPYEVRYLAEKHGISQQEAQRLIDQHGNSRESWTRQLTA